MSAPEDLKKRSLLQQPQPSKTPSTKITLDKNGDIISLTDKRNNKELVKDGKAIRLALFTENKVVRMACMGNPERDHRP